MLPFSKYLIVAILVVTGLVLGLVLSFNMLPLEFFLILLGLLLFILGVLIFLIVSKKYYLRIVGSFFSLMYLVLVIMFLVDRLNR